MKNSMTKEAVFRRLLSYSLKYKVRFSVGIVFAFMTAIFNAASLTVLVPLFDAIGAGKTHNFRLELTLPEKKIIAKERIFGSDSLDGLEKLKKIRVTKKFV